MQDLPRLIARHRLRRPIFVFDDQLGHQLRTPDREMISEIDPTPHPHRERIEPTVSEHGSENVLAALKCICQIVARVINPAFETRPGWIESVIRKGSAVHTELVVAQPGSV